MYPLNFPLINIILLAFQHDSSSYVEIVHELLYILLLETAKFIKLFFELSDTIPCLHDVLWALGTIAGHTIHDIEAMLLDIRTFDDILSLSRGMNGPQRIEIFSLLGGLR